jgi:hypothetical protein
MAAVMTKKSSSKDQPRAAGSKEIQHQDKHGLSSFLWIGGLIAVVAIAVVVLRPRAEPAASAAASTATGSPASSATPLADAAPEPGAAVQTPEPDAATKAKVDAVAKLGPHKQQSLPPIPFQGYAPPRPPEVVTAAYQFAAEHPEILSYVPCFCGCERGGHTGNHDCFVKSRAPNGDVTEWDPHGVECTVCIDVANRSRQMYASGASVRDIRAAIEKEFGPLSPLRTPTPHPPALANHD